MKKTNSIRVLGMLGLVLLAGILGTGCWPGQTISVPITVTVANNLTIPDFNVMDPGTVIPEGFQSQSIPICELPSQEEIRALVEQALGGFTANLLVIDSINLNDVTATASVGDFNSLDYVKLYWQPKALNGQAQPQEVLGDASAPPALGVRLVLDPPAPVDFLDIMNEEAANPNTDCSSVGFELRGTVPETYPVFTVVLNMTVVGHLNIF